MTQALAVVIAMLTLGIGLMYWYFDGKLEAANAATVEAQTALGKEEESRAGFQAAATACSDSVAALKAENAKRDGEYKAGLAKSRQRTADAEAVINRLLSTPRPEGLNECQATLKELDDEIDDRHPNR